VWQLSLAVSLAALGVSVAAFRRAGDFRRDDQRFRWSLQLERAVKVHSRLEIAIERTERAVADCEQLVLQLAQLNPAAPALLAEPAADVKAGAAEVRANIEHARESLRQGNVVLEHLWLSSDTSAESLVMLQQVETEIEARTGQLDESHSVLVQRIDRLRTLISRRMRGDGA
jgi:hypothetical protein